MKIYIQAPISGRDRQEYEAEFAQLEEIVRSLGHEPVNPLSLSGEADTETAYITRDLAALLQCDALLAHNASLDYRAGEPLSHGCMAELVVAALYGLKILALDGDGGLRNIPTGAALMFGAAGMIYHYAQSAMIVACISEDGTSYTSTGVGGKPLDIGALILQTLERNDDMRDLIASLLLAKKLSKEGVPVKII